MRQRFIFIVLLAALASCTSDPAPSSGESARKTTFDGFVLQPSAIYFGEENEKYISVIDTNSVIIKAGVPESLMPKEGEVIFLPASEANPDGFLGKVASTQSHSAGTAIETEPCSLEEVFLELSLDEEVSVSEKMDRVEEEDGTSVECGMLPDDVWEDPQGVMDSDTEGTKAGFQGSETYTRRIPFSYEHISGEVVLSAAVSVKVEIHNGQLTDYDVVLRKKSFVSVKAEIEADGEKTIPILPSKTFRLPVSIPVGPIVLRPAIVASLDFTSSGSVKLGASIGVGMEDVKNRWHNGERTTTYGDSNPNYVGAYYMDAEGSIGLKGRVALQFGVFGQKLLAFGIDAVPTVSIDLSGKIEMDNKDLLSSELTSTLSLETSLGLYLYSKLFSSKFEKLRVSVNVPSKSWELDLLDPGKGLKLTKETGSWTASGEFGGKKFMAIDERGFALFAKDRDEPVELRAALSTKAGAGEVVFDISGDPSLYTVRPYNKVGKYLFYGAPIAKLIKSVTDASTGTKYRFEYDKAGRVVKVIRNQGYEDETFTISYSDNTVVFLAPYDRVTGFLNGDGLLVKVEDHYNDGEIFHSYSTTISYDSDMNPVFGDLPIIYDRGNHIWSGKERSYSYGDKDDTMNLDLFHFFIEPPQTERLVPFVSFPHIHNRKLCTGINNYYENSAYDEHFAVSYAFDEGGDVEKIYLDGTEYLSITY